MALEYVFNDSNVIIFVVEFWSYFVDLQNFKKDTQKFLDFRVLPASRGVTLEGGGIFSSLSET